MIITGFQLRAAKASLNLDYNTLSNDTNVSKITLSRLVNTIKNLDEITCSVQDAHNLYNYFRDKELIFPNQHTVAMNYPIEKRSVINNITRFQLVVARTALRLSQRDFAKNITSITRSSFQKFEEQKDNDYFKNTKLSPTKIIVFFNKQGVSFPGNSSVSILS
jgi:hypothetical protein